MARLIEIKGLGADIAGIKKGMGDLRKIAAEVGAEHTGLKAELGDLKDQLQAHRADLRFEAESLGNGGGHVDEPPLKSEVEPSKPADDHVEPPAIQ